MAKRDASLHLPSGNVVRIVITPSLHGSDLFNMAASQFGLHEKSHFGVKWLNNTLDCYQWLAMEGKVLDQVPKGTELNLIFGVRFYVSDVSIFSEFITQKVFFLDVMNLVKSGTLYCPPDTAVQLSALALQVMQGDYISDSATRHHIDTSKLIPDDTILHFASSLEKCAAMVSKVYQDLMGTSEPSAVLSYMSIVQQLSTYGVHYYSVKDGGTEAACLLAITPRGISQYDVKDRETPRHTWIWSQVENVYWKKKTKFELELLEDKHDNSKITTKTWITKHAIVSDQMFKMVVFQHKQSIEELKQTRRKQRMASTPPANQILSRTQRSTSSIQSSSSSVSKRLLPAAQEVHIPETAVGVERLLASGSRTSSGDKTASSPVVRLFPPSARQSDVEQMPEDLLDILERRRDQLRAELDRKNKLLQSYIEQEREFEEVSENENETKKCD
eukprot:m.19106 g.19106  ORF g.19106 m.19106 type:complete len:445 (-) comp6485_c0_seq2:111-1445(-)